MSSCKLMNSHNSLLTRGEDMLGKQLCKNDPSVRHRISVCWECTQQQVVSKLHVWHTAIRKHKATQSQVPTTPMRSQGNAAAEWYVIANCTHCAVCQLKKFLKSVLIWHRYGQKFSHVFSGPLIVYNHWRPHLSSDCCIGLEQSAGVSPVVSVVARFPQQTENRTFCLVLQSWLTTSHCTD